MPSMTDTAVCGPRGSPTPLLGSPPPPSTLAPPQTLLTSLCQPALQKQSQPPQQVCNTRCTCIASLTLAQLGVNICLDRVNIHLFACLTGPWHIWLNDLPRQSQHTSLPACLTGHLHDMPFLPSLFFIIEMCCIDPPSAAPSLPPTPLNPAHCSPPHSPLFSASQPLGIVSMGPATLAQSSTSLLCMTFRYSYDCCACDPAARYGLRMASSLPVWAFCMICSSCITSVQPVASLPLTAKSGSSSRHSLSQLSSAPTCRAT